MARKFVIELDDDEFDEVIGALLDSCSDFGCGCYRTEGREMCSSADLSFRLKALRDS